MLKIEILLLTNNAILPFQNLKRDFNLDFVELNKLFATKSLAEHGLGFLINVYEKDDKSSEIKLIKQIIFDTGGTNQTFLHNLDIRGYPIYDTDLIILSHWHYDHSGGLYNILQRIEKPVSVICHESAYYERFFNRTIDIDPKILLNKNRDEITKHLNTSKIVNQLPIDLGKLKQHGGEFEISKNLKTIFTRNNLRMMVSGEIPRIHKKEEFSNFLINKDEIVKVDKILDDKCLIIEIENSTIIINGCCHSGIMNTMDYAKENTRKPISHIIGGFHMANSSQARINVTLNYLYNYQKENIILFPIHCSGEKFIKDINSMNIPRIKAFNASVGTVFNFYT